MSVFNETFINGITLFKQVLEKANGLGKKFNELAKKDLAAQKAKYDAPPPDGATASQLAEYSAFKLEYDNVSTTQKNLETALEKIPELTARVDALEKEFIEVRNAAPKSGGRKKSRKQNRKTRRSKKARNTRRKNRRT
jgi:hypothetical protein